MNRTDTKTLRKNWCNIRLTEDEFNQLRQKVEATTCRKLSDYVRDVLFNKPITTRQRNVSLDDFMDQLAVLRAEFNAVGNNFNQVVRKLNSIPPSAEYVSYLRPAQELQRNLLMRIDTLQASIDKFYGQWSRA